MNEINVYADIRDKIKAVVPRLVENSIIANDQEEQKLCTNIDEKLADFKPQLMVYGCYNAGKSTLLNALLGKEIAKTGDTPETFKVDSYEIQNYKIWDTPGIHAPIKHEEVTSEHYKKCEVVLFVMSNDSSVEDEYIYEKIQNVVEDKKPIIIILNNKMGFDMNSQDIARQKQKIYANMAKTGISNEQLEQIKVICVNAKTALKAKLEQKNILLEASKIKELESYIYGCMKNIGKDEIINALNLQINSRIAKLMSAVQNAEENDEIRETQKLLEDIIKQKASAKKTLEQIINIEIAPMEDEVFNDILNGGKNLENIATKYAQNISAKISDQFNLIVNNVGLSLAQYAANNIQSAEKTDSKDADFISEVGKLINGHLTDDMLKDGAKETTKFILGKIKEWLPGLMKGKGAAWIGKTAGTIGVIIGPVITLAEIVYDKLNQENAKKEEIKRKRELHIAARNGAKDICYGLNEQISKNAGEQISNLYDSKITELEESFAQKESNKEELKQIHAELANILKELPAV